MDLSKTLPALNCNKLSTKEEQAKLVLTGYSNPIRNMAKEDVVKSVGAMISICATMYCGMQENKMLVETIQESVRLVYKHYPQISVNEIREAFSMAAANRFEQVNMTAYYGTFTVSMLGDILSAYIEFRRPIIAEAIRIITEQEAKLSKELEREQRNEYTKKNIQEEIDAAIIAVQSGSELVWESWQDVPVHYAEIAVLNGWIEVSDSFKKEVWERSKALAVEELSRVSSDLTNLIEAKKARAQLKSIFETQAVPDPAKRIYSKLLIWEYVKLHEI